MKLRFYFTSVIFCTMVLFASCSDAGKGEMSTGYEALPDISRSFIEYCFPSNAVVHVSLKQDNSNQTYYNVTLDDGTKIEFDASGEWTKVETERELLPLALFLPTKLILHIIEYYNYDRPMPQIYKVERSSSGYKLSMKYSWLLYDYDGSFIGEYEW